MLGWVGFLGTGRAVLGEVVLDGLRVVADLAEVDRLAALGEKQEGVELGEELLGRLVDSDEDGLADVGELAEETDGVVGGLAIETGGGLVEEDEDAGLGDQLDTNGHTLALFDRETGADATDEGIGQIMKLQKINDGVDVLELLLTGNLTGLTKEGRELEGLTDS